MTNSEINEFLGGTDYQLEIVEKLETLQQTLEQAMQPIVPKYKEDDNELKAKARQSYDITFLYEGLPEDLNHYEVCVYQYLYNSGRQCNLSDISILDVRGVPVRELARVLRVSKTTIKRALNTLLQKNMIIRHPHFPGYIPNDTNAWLNDEALDKEFESFLNDLDI